jgi:hypothetical protein
MAEFFFCVACILVEKAEVTGKFIVFFEYQLIVGLINPNYNSNSILVSFESTFPLMAYECRTSSYSFRVIMKHCFLGEKNTVKAKAWIDKHCLDSAPAKSTVEDWFAKLKRGKTCIEVQWTPERGCFRRKYQESPTK